MTTLRLPVPTEHDEQVKLFRWAELASARYPELAEMFAVPNGGHRHKAVAGKLRAEGVKRGVEDVMLLVPRGKYHGLLIEMKRADSHPSDTKLEQLAWHRIHEARGFCVRVCRGFDEAHRVVTDYLNERIHTAEGGEK